MKKQILFFLLFNAYFFVSGQNTFTLLISDSTNEYPGDIIELSDHSFVLSSVFFTDSSELAAQRFFKLSKKGKISHDLTLRNPKGLASLLKLVYITDTNIFCIGDWHNLNERVQKWVVGIDSGFTIHWNKRQKINYNYAKTAVAFINSKRRIISAATATNDISHTKLYFQEYSLTGDSIKSSIDSVSSIAIIYSMMEYPGLGSYRAAVMAYNRSSPGSLLMIDSTLKVNNYDSIPNGVSMYNSLKKINDSSFFLSGNIYPNQSHDYAIMLLKENNDCKKLFILGKIDTMSYAGIVQSLDFLDPNKVFLGATSNLALYSGHYGEQNSWYALSNFDSSLNFRWTKYYGGDAYYLLQSVVATKDGGVIMVGTRYDYPTQSYKCDVFLEKVNENGELINDVQLQHPTIHDAIVYPNPGSDHLIVESGPQISGAQFRMTTIDGKQVIVKLLKDRKTTFETQFLPSGTYVWQIVLNDRVVETGKWIKE